MRAQPLAHSSREGGKIDPKRRHELWHPQESLQPNATSVLSYCVDVARRRRRLAAGSIQLFTKALFPSVAAAATGANSAAGPAFITVATLAKCAKLPVREGATAL